SQHMNMNEVLANRANELLGGRLGEYAFVHPNDHVNMGQSSNDVTPTAIRLAALTLWEKLRASLNELQDGFQQKAREFDGNLKAGRTHLQDAVPIRLGQEFGAYAHAVRRATERIAQAAEGVGSLNLGASAVGTGLNTDPRYRELAVGYLAELTGLSVRPAENLFEVTQSMADLVEMSSALRGLAVELARIANDLRLLSSGPRTGLDEITLPPVQPGSSIMPGKVNPVMAEMLDMVAFEVIGNDTTVMLAGQAGQLDLNVMTPVIANDLLDSLEILTNACRVFARRCVAGIEPHAKRLQHYADASLGLATALNPYIGYRAAAEIAEDSLTTGKTIKELVIERGLLTQEQAAELLSPRFMTEPHPKK
ncbi:MAG TPA: aspartate ammonia-lyase, partial [Candidatus Methylomirabilis sp.]|nr:aspartate ammonia-lyase [Candidatus Methylomirabilis sp.]